MEFPNSFTVDLPLDDTWKVLLDLERLAPCMPGAKLTSVDGDEYCGVVKVKVGSLMAEYQGTASFADVDVDAHTATLVAQGRETRGQGRAKADIRASLTPTDGGTRVDVTTDLNITGRVAQFGRGVMQDISTKLLDQFASSLQAELDLYGVDGPRQRDAVPRAVNTDHEPDPIDLLSVGSGPALRQLAPVAGVAALVAFLVWLARRR